MDVEEEQSDELWEAYPRGQPYWGTEEGRGIRACESLQENT